MDNSIVVHKGALHDHSYSKATAEREKVAEPTNRTRNGATPSTPPTSACSMPYIRQTLQGRGIPEYTTSILLASWRKSTQKQYLCHQRKWMRFCNSRQIDPFHPSIIQVLEFLTSLFQAGMSYSSINAARSALSALLSCKQRTTIGTHPLVTRFLKGTFELRPPTPKYSHIWDASIVLNHLQMEYPLNGLSLKQTSQKLVMLIALTTAQRLQTLHLLDTKHLHISKDKAVFLINNHIKQSRPGSKPMQIELQPYQPDARLDVFYLLKQYLQQTVTLRGNETRLFISYKPPHKHVSKDTLA